MGSRPTHSARPAARSPGSYATAPGDGADFQNGLVVDGRRRIVVSGSSDLGPAGGGGRWRLQRFTPDGAVDRSFGHRGTVLTQMSGVGGDDEHLWRIALQPDGKIVAVGYAVTATGGEDFALARYLPDGRLDPSFGTGGRVFTALAPGAGDDEAQAVQVLGNGRIVVAGFAGTGADSSGRDLALARYLPDGRLDPSFGSGGLVVRDVAGGRDQFKAMTLDRRGRIVAVGSADLGAGAGGTSFAVARYRADGRPDAFG
ncbi:delta-60 repeat domain-containing protein [Streptomyces sp. NPDC060031]|uniref:delta-60 repeat domain-containing protein n=1 Tax=Streptomyces sp. NPDC060031 TaxID=3347043 RepID=UPI0036D06A16